MVPVVLGPVFSALVLVTREKRHKKNRLCLHEKAGVGWLVVGGAIVRHGNDKTRRLVARPLAHTARHIVVEKRTEGAVACVARFVLDIVQNGARVVSRVKRHGAVVGERVQAKIRGSTPWLTGVICRGQATRIVHGVCVRRALVGAVACKDASAAIRGAAL